MIQGIVEDVAVLPHGGATTSFTPELQPPNANSLAGD